MNVRTFFSVFFAANIIFFFYSHIFMVAEGGVNG